MINVHRSFAFPVLSKLSPFNISKTGSYLEGNKNSILQKYGAVSIFFNCLDNFIIIL
jgi:hypothetical protein